jgi:Ala-tRNA(Pro) deacylase
MDLVKFLKANKVKFELRHHPARFTAQEVAAAEHITGEDVAKVVVVRVDDAFAMCVLPATFVLDMKKAKKVVGGKKVALATEEEMAKLFPDCEIGAMPPFGKDCNVPVYVEEHLAAQEQILIPAGTHEDSVLLAWKDYERLAAPKVTSFGRHVQ